MLNGEEGLVATVEATLSLASTTIVHGGLGKPALCVIAKIVTQPVEDEADAITVTGVSILGESVEAEIATAFVRQIEKLMTVQTMASQSGGGPILKPPAPPHPPTMLPCCVCDCQNRVWLPGQTHCANQYKECLREWGGYLVAGLAACLIPCILTGLGWAACVKLCGGVLVLFLGPAFASCTLNFQSCMQGVSLLTTACLLGCQQNS